MYLCVQWRPGEGWGPGPFDLPAWLGEGNSPGLTLTCTLPTSAAGIGGGVGRGGGCLPWLPWLAVPQLPSHHAPALPETPDLRSGAALPGCQASFPISQGSYPLRLLEPVPRKTGLEAAYPSTPRGAFDCKQVPTQVSARALHPGADQRPNFPTPHPPPALEGPTNPQGPRQCPCGARVPALVAQTGIMQSHTFSRRQAALHLPIVIPEKVLHRWPWACALLAAALKEAT